MMEMCADVERFCIDLMREQNLNNQMTQMIEFMSLLFDEHRTVIQEFDEFTLDNKLQMINELTPCNYFKFSVLIIHGKRHSDLVFYIARRIAVYSRLNGGFENMIRGFIKRITN